MAMNEKAIGQLSGLAGRLVAESLISAQAASQAQKDASLERMHFVQYLVERKNVDSRRLAEVASHEFGVPLFDLHAFNRSAIPEGLVDLYLVTKHHALPLFRRGNRLFIAVSDPTNLAALDEIKFHTGINTDAVLIEERILSHNHRRVGRGPGHARRWSGRTWTPRISMTSMSPRSAEDAATASEGSGMTASTRRPSSVSSTRC